MKHQEGFSVVEMMIASSVLAIVLGGSMALQTRVMTQTTSNNHRAFASEKATQMFEELRSFVQSNKETDISKLQNFSDGSRYNSILTTEKKIITTSTGEDAVDLSNPADSLSGNVRLGSSGNWRFVRQVQVNPVPNDPNARYVSVRVWKTKKGSANEPNGQPLASIAGILKTNITADPPTQVYDLYLLGMENAPSWWVDMADLRPSFERTLLDLEQRNPGLTFRRHFINKFGFGRDPYYMPYINNDPTRHAGNQPLPWSYLYPGRISHSSLSENYVLGNIDGRIRTDTTDDYFPLRKDHVNYAPGGSSAGDYREYSLADQFNHVMRFPEQFAMENRLVDQDPDTYRENTSLSMFLHRLNEGALKNAIIVNLHGELLPVPPVRNYSDPVKVPTLHARRLDAVNPNADPANGGAQSLPASFDANNNDNDNDNYVSMSYKRVVTHPENLRYDNDATVAWRVYPYEEIRPGTNSNTSLPNTANKSTDTIPITSLFIPTIGAGPRYDGVAGSGFLSYPDLTLTNADLVAVRNALEIEKIVGSNDQRYERWENTPTGRPNTVTFTHDPTNDNAAFVVSGILPAGRTIADLLLLPALFTDFTNERRAASAIQSATTNTLTFNPISSSLPFPFSTTSYSLEREHLLNSLIVIGAGTANEEVRRVTNVAGNVITFDPPLASVPAAGTVITRHKDFDVEIVNENMFEQSHRGIRVLLYDTPTRHPRDSSNTGLRDSRRLDGLEYIPAPVVDSGGTPSFEDRDLTDNGSNNFKNTARWRVALDTSAAVFGGALNYTGPGTDGTAVPVLPLETRVLTTEHTFGAKSFNGGNVNYRSTAASPIAGCTPNLGELCDGIWGDGDTYVPNFLSTSGVNENLTQPRSNLSNVSRTYVYMNHEFTDKSGLDFDANRIPKLEQAQFMGDALLNPYADVKDLHRYNRHYRNRTSGNGISGFNRASGTSWANTDVDMNWFYNLYNNGLMRSNAIYNSISGYSNYYYSIGGELGTDGTNAIFPINRQPWVETDTSASVNNNSSTINEITVTSRVIASTSASTSGSTRWRSRLFSGELYPDNEHAFWVANGNLPTDDYNNATHHANLLFGEPAAPTNSQVYFRKRANQSGDSFNGTSSNRRMQQTGAPSFMNGSGNPTGSINSGFQHTFNGGTARLTSGAGQFVVNSFNLNLNDSLGANRPYILTGSGGSGGYQTTEFQNLRNRLNFINTSDGSLSPTPDNSNTYYDHSTGNGRTSSAIIRMSRPKPGDTSEDVPELKGYVLMNGLQNTSGTGVQEMARFTQAGSLQTYMDAGDREIPGDAPGRTVQLPRVEILSPRASQIQVNPNIINVQYQVDWLRWDGEPYSPAYPPGWYDSVPLMYNVKYSRDNKRSWIYAHSDDPVEPRFVQAYNPAAIISPPAASTSAVSTGSFAWDASALPRGNYVFRIEAYREGYVDVGYSYHDVFVTIEK